MPALKVPPVAALGVMAYGLPATFAVPAAPALVSVTLPIDSPFFRPVEVNSPPVKLIVWP